MPQNEIYVPIKIGKFTGLPPQNVHIVVFYKNRKEPFIGYYHMGEWYDEYGEQTKTPVCWLKRELLTNGQNPEEENIKK